ncbi:MAG: hypothetical protein WCU00_06440 [Candidatus Latescibacterota bacterium]|jgi:hypothetical protein
MAVESSQTPVRIAFDEGSNRIDLLTGKQVPSYTMIERASIRFHLNRLNKADEFFQFFHDGIQRANLSSLASMEKVQPQFSIWRLRYRSGSKNTPRVHHLAVSFIPLSPVTGKPESRVHLMLDDLKLIDWGADASK